MLLQLYTTVEAEWFGHGDSIRHGHVSQDQENTLDKWVTGLVSADEEQNTLAIIRFGALMMLTGIMWEAVCIPYQML